MNKRQRKKHYGYGICYHWWTDGESLTICKLKRCNNPVCHNCKHYYCRKFYKPIKGLLPF